MTAAKFLHTTHGVDLFERPNGDVYGYRGTAVAGMTWHNGMEWRAERTGECDYRVASRHAGIAYIVRGCPDCVCIQVLCDDSGRHCTDVGCRFCLHGCTEDEREAKT